MKLYENVAIGNFLYGLGFAVGKRVEGHNFPSIVNLLQQTPDDTVLGDVLIQAPGQLRIFEFKQRNNYDPKEAIRHKKLEERLANDVTLTNISKIIHWFIETSPNDNTFYSRIVPYLDAYPRTNSKYDFATFVNETADAIVGNTTPLAKEDMAKYLAWLSSLYKTGSVGSGGLIVKMSANGDLFYAELTSIRDLVLTRSSILERQTELEPTQLKEKSTQRVRERGFDHER